MNKFDLIIIGGGAGAFAAAIRANELKAKTAMINAGLPLGGTCVNVGCVPSKTLIYAAEVLYRSQHHDIPGIELTLKNFDFQKIVQDELSLVEKLRQEKYEKVLKNLEHVTAIEGKAKFVSEDEIEIKSARNPEPHRIQGQKFIIATGSTATIPPIENVREVGFVTHVEALKLKKQPRELIVVGAGPLGLEFAQMYSRFGTKVTILQRGPSIFPPAERELTDRLRDILKKEGVTIKTDVEVKTAQVKNGKKILSYSIAGKVDEVSGDEILLATGKTPNSDGLGLSKINVEVNDKKAIVVDQYFQTTQPHVYAVGDVTNLPLRLEPTAGHEGTLAAENALLAYSVPLSGTAKAGRSSGASEDRALKSIDYNSVPYTIFTDPQLAGVGFSEEVQMKAMGVCACRTVSFADVPKAIIMRQIEGLIKMTIHPETRQILGVHILAPSAGELIAQAMVLVKNKNTIDDVTSSLPMFPTLSEAIKLVAFSFTKDISKLSCCI